MCGRSAWAMRDKTITAFDITATHHDTLVTQTVSGHGSYAPVIAQAKDGARMLSAAMWNFPTRHGSSVWNATAERLDSSPTWAGAFHHQLDIGQRCIVPMAGFFEGFPRAEFARTDHQLIAAAGLFFPRSDPWRVVVITEPASEPVASVHHRQPVLIAASGRDQWLDRGVTTLSLQHVSEHPELAVVL